MATLLSAQDWYHRRDETMPNLKAPEVGDWVRFHAVVPPGPMLSRELIDTIVGIVVYAPAGYVRVKIESISDYAAVHGFQRGTETDVQIEVLTEISKPVPPISGPSAGVVGPVEGLGSGNY